MSPVFCVFLLHSDDEFLFDKLTCALTFEYRKLLNGGGNDQCNTSPYLLYQKPFWPVS